MLRMARQSFPTGLSWQLGQDELLKAAEVIDSWDVQPMAGKFTELEIDFADPHALARHGRKPPTLTFAQNSRASSSSLASKRTDSLSTRYSTAHSAYSITRQPYRREESPAIAVDGRTPEFSYDGGLSAYTDGRGMPHH